MMKKEKLKISTDILLRQTMANCQPSSANCQPSSAYCQLPSAN
jgi:hypothetical protein